MIQEPQVGDFVWAKLGDPSEENYVEGTVVLNQQPGSTFIKIEWTKRIWEGRDYSHIKIIPRYHHANIAHVRVISRP